MLKNGGGTSRRFASSTRSNHNATTTAAADFSHPLKTSTALADGRSGVASKKRSESGSFSAPRSKETKLSVQSPPELSDSESEETDLSSSEGDDSSWISWFCGLKGNELLCEVDEDYIQDDFNLCGLQGQVPYYDYALDMILDNDSVSGEGNGEEHTEIESAAELLYGLIHARYVLSSKGLNSMHEKYKRVDFGRCPRIFCGGQPCLPVGTSDIPRNGSVKIYCPKCEDLYFPRCKYQISIQAFLLATIALLLLDGVSCVNWYHFLNWETNLDIDGAYFGTTFPHLYLMTYPSTKATKPVQSYVPRVFGFKIHKSFR